MENGSSPSAGVSYSTGVSSDLNPRRTLEQAIAEVSKAEETGLVSSIRKRAIVSVNGVNHDKRKCD